MCEYSKAGSEAIASLWQLWEWFVRSLEIKRLNYHNLEIVAVPVHTVCIIYLLEVREKLKLILYNTIDKRISQNLQFIY